MNRHPYLRAYMAGIVIPTLFTLIGVSAFAIFRLPIEKVIAFPLAIVPNVWGVWNAVHLRFARRVPLGIFGAILPFLLLPGGYVLTRLVHFEIPDALLHAAAYAFPAGVIVYYLLWKHVVGSLNAIVGLP